MSDFSEKYPIRPKIKARVNIISFLICSEFAQNMVYMKGEKGELLPKIMIKERRINTIMMGVNHHFFLSNKKPNISLRISISFPLWHVLHIPTSVASLSGELPHAKAVRLPASTRSLALTCGIPLRYSSMARVEDSSPQACLP